MSITHSTMLICQKKVHKYFFFFDIKKFTNLSGVKGIYMNLNDFLYIKIKLPDIFSYLVRKDILSYENIYFLSKYMKFEF